jgi:carbamoyl-phosphate synthase large subunit
MNNVAVTGMNAGDTPAPGIAVIRCLREHPDWQGRIIGLAYEALESGLLDKQMIDAAYLLPYSLLGRDALFERVQYINDREHIDAIIPTLDAELSNFIGIRERLEDSGIKLFLPTEEQLSRGSKLNLHKLSEETGIRTPATQFITDPAKITINRESLPVMVKGLFYEAYLAHTVDEAEQYVHKIAARWGYPVLIQEYIEGEEFNAAAVCDEKVLGLVCMKKLVLTDKGKGWACVSIRNDDLIEMSERIVKALKWRGAIEVEAIRSKKNGGFYLIELNPRFPSWIYLAKASGINLPYMYLRRAMGKEVSILPDYKTGVVFSNHTTNLITDLSTIETLFTAGEIHYEKGL